MEDYAVMASFLTYHCCAPPRSPEIEEIAMSDPPCGICFAICAATAKIVVLESVPGIIRLDNTLNDVECAIKIDLARALPCLKRHRQEFRERAYPNIGDEDVDPAERLHSCFNDLREGELLNAICAFR